MTVEVDSGSSVIAAATAFRFPYLPSPNVVPSLVKIPVLNAVETRWTKPGDGLLTPWYWTNFLEMKGAELGYLSNEVSRASISY